MKHVTLPGGEVVPSMGQGTWKMGERAERRSDEIAALRAGVELGMTLVDTAEMYGDPLQSPPSRPRAGPVAMARRS